MGIDSVANTSDNVSDVVNKTAAMAESAMEKGYESARELTDTGLDYIGDLTERVSGFVKRDPWIAVAGAFVIGYAAAYLFRRIK